MHYISMEWYVNAECAESILTATFMNFNREKTGSHYMLRYRYTHKRMTADDSRRGGENPGCKATVRIQSADHAKKEEIIMQKFTSAATSINSKRAPAIYSMKKAIDIMKGKSVVDIGGGKYDIAIEKAAAYGATVSIYDKYNRSAEHNKKVLARKYDVAVISNVLNVIDDINDRFAVIQTALSHADIVLITVYEGDKSGIGEQSGKDSWQENRPTADYVDELKIFVPELHVERHGKLITIFKA